MRRAREAGVRRTREAGAGAVPTAGGRGPLGARADEAIPPEAERGFAARMGATTVEVPAGHLVMITHADDVAGLVRTAAETLAR